MMELKGLQDYIKGLENVKNVIPTIEVLDPETNEEAYLIKHTKEIYLFETNKELLAKIDEVKVLPGFVGVKKKFIEEKLDKNGDVKQEEAYQLTVEIDH